MPTDYRRLAVALSLVCTYSMGCGYKHDPDAYFPEDWESSYEIVADCDETKHPRRGYMEVWIDPDGLAAFSAGETLPTGSVLVKAQWDEANCKDEPDLYTVMRAKDDGGWDWQTIGSKGDVQDTDDAFCSSCHATCGDSLLCTEP